MKIIILEDDKTIAFAIKTYLLKDGMHIYHFDTLASMENIKIENYDLMILDANLPDGSGFDYLKYIREYSQIPIIMLTVKNSEENVLKGFDYGADEYITKPFSLPILKARIDNVMKRRKQREKLIHCHDLILNMEYKYVKIGNENIELSRQEYGVLELLLLNKGICVSRERLIDSVWAYNLYEVNDNTLTVTLKRLRQKLGAYGKYIKTLRGIGYIWEMEAGDESK